MQNASIPSRPAACPPVVVLGICGGIAAYKAVDLASRLRKLGYDVHVAMSEAAAKFVTPLTFAAVTGNRVMAEQFPDAARTQGEGLYPHLYPSTRADAFILVPATADMLARVAHGLGMDPVSTATLSLPSTCRRFLCPAMNVEMWGQQVVQANVAKLESAGWMRIGPASGLLACGMEGEGRMSEPAEIADRFAAAMKEGLRLAGRRVLVISGPTREHIDPVRFIGNPSTGKMGKALAEEALRGGAQVDFVTGPVAEEQVPQGSGLAIHRVISAQDMLEKSRELYAAADAVIYAAAVADYRPAVRHDKKLPKEPGDVMLKLEATPDVAATLNQARRPGQVTIGFALQTHDAVEKATAKLVKKNLDGIVLNSMDALGGESGTYTWITQGPAGGVITEWGKLDKHECARRILGEAAARLA